MIPLPNGSDRSKVSLVHLAIIKLNIDLNVINQEFATCPYNDDVMLLETQILDVKTHLSLCTQPSAIVRIRLKLTLLKKKLKYKLAHPKDFIGRLRTVNDKITELEEFIF